MLYRVSNTQVKNKDWKVITIDTEDGLSHFDNVSVNRVGKKGDSFPNFDGIVDGAVIEGNEWTSPSNKFYLFPPKPNTSPKGQNSSITKAMAQKAQNIEASQERKTEAIRTSQTMRDAVLIATTMAVYEKYTSQQMQDNILEWRAWLDEHYDG